MKRIAVFAEGQTEAIFIREFLLRLIDPSKLSYSYIKLNADIMQRVREYSCPNPEVHFDIINVQNDEKVLTVIKETEKSLIERGQYEKIIGLRDMYSGEYDKRSHGRINDNVTNQIMNIHKSIIQTMRYSNRIKLYYCIMEIEAWFLSMYNVFPRIDSTLSADYIASHLGFDLRVIDPQKAFFKPSRELHKIFELCGLEYKKKKGDVEKITSKIEVQDFDDARENDRCGCFDVFYREIRDCV